MGKVWVLFKNNLKMMILKKTAVFIMSILGPVIITLVLSQYLSFGSGYINGVIIDEDNTKSSMVISEMMKSEDYIEFTDGNKNTLEDKFAIGDIELAIIIPKGFEKDLIESKSPKITLKELEDGNINDGVKVSLDEEIRNLNYLSKASRGNKDEYLKAISEYKNNHVSIERASLNDLSNDYVKSQIFLGFLIMFMLYRAMNGATLITLDKESNIYTRIFVSDLKTNHYYIANILSSIATLMIQVTLALIGMKFITKLEIGIPYYQLWIILLLVALVAVSIGVFCISITYNRQEVTNCYK